MLKLAKAKKGERIIDIGCGDGKIILALAQKGFAVEGVDIDPFLLKKCKKKIKQMRLGKLVNVYRQNFWKLNLAKYDLIFFYGIPHVMRRLEKKLLAELKPGSRVVSNYFKFPNWEPEKVKDHVRLYRR